MITPFFNFFNFSHLLLLNSEKCVVGVPLNKTKATKPQNMTWNDIIINTREILVALHITARIICRKLRILNIIIRGRKKVEILDLQ